MIGWGCSSYFVTVAGVPRACAKDVQRLKKLDAREMMAGRSASESCCSSLRAGLSGCRRPFLLNCFSDPDIIPLAAGILRKPIAK